jgi:hypothetical protein
LWSHHVEDHGDLDDGLVVVNDAIEIQRLEKGFITASLQFWGHEYKLVKVIFVVARGR